MRVFLGDRIFRHERILEFFRRVAWFGRGKQRVNVPASFVARSNRLRGDFGNDAAKQQTVSC